MTQDTIKTRLRAALALIDQPHKWTQGALRRDFTGSLPRDTGRSVVSRCAYGALVDASKGGEDCELAIHLRRSIYAHGGPADGVTSWNDAPQRTHSQVMLAFDRAIADTHPD